MEDIDFIRKFSKITIKNVCKKQKANRSNILNNRASKNTIKRVKRQIENDLAELYIIKDDDYDKKG